jgi:opacity protein-like surface antigen
MERDSITASVSADGDVQVLSFMLNTYFDIDTGTALTPFIGGGIGVAKIDAEIRARGSVSESVSDDDVVFAYQGIVGVAYAINANTSLDLSYRYFATADPDFEDEYDIGYDHFKGGLDSEYGGNHLMLGFRYSF